MFEIILLIFLCNKNSKLAEQKNVSKRGWVLRTIFYWIAGEIMGLMLLMATITIDGEAFQAEKEITKELIYLMCAGLLGGYLGYLFTRKRLEDLPTSNGLEE